ncbi:alpha/beta hydrolase [Chromobacterium sp. IIBBL 290-4]|uniref:alpha/beta hydrolase n=1 Tax=Chromobacterium sp. IIBBL 290-4 TaxID=2953890 RepID=UPI0020B6BBEC|nr:alpha/beta fold hydrolase [Chromobacterium sp. IIBBL 290-4]UTH74747.1 lysophospholipase [Chromobacterium sp. IIBBL 290-4]
MRFPTFAVLAIAALCAGRASAAVDQAIELNTATGRIAGSLMLPDHADKPPVALIIAGSGPTNRDGDNPGLPYGSGGYLKQLAQALAEAGIASVRYDKRAIGESRAAGLDEAALHFDDYVGDAAGWVAKLKTDARFSKVAVIGHSEGSLIGMLAAEKQNAAAFVSLDGPASNAADILRLQLAPRLPEDLAKQSDRILQALRQGREADNVPGPLMVVYRPSIQPYLISWFRYTPSEALRALKAPALIIQGGADHQVAKSEGKTLHAAKPDSQFLLIPGMNHLLRDDEANVQASYGAAPQPLAPELPSALIRFLKQSL